MFKLEFSTDNAAFGEDQFSRDTEITRIIDNIVNEIELWNKTSGPVIDINGNKVGEWEIT